MIQHIGRKLLRVRQVVVLVACFAVVALADGPPGANHKKQQAPPIKLGTSGSNVKDINSSFCCVGTLGALVKKGTATYILSNNHVLARSNAAVLGEAIMHRGYVDTTPACSKNGTFNVANLSQFVQLKFGGTLNNTMDVAIAKTIAGKVSSTGQILDIGTVSTATAVPALNMNVKKSGRTTGLTSGKITSVNVTVNVGGYGACGSGTKVAKFVGQFFVTPGSFSSGGDSGSLIVKPVSVGRPNPVGLLFAGSTSVAVGSPINALLSALGATFVGVQPSSTQEMANSMSEPADQRIAAATEVKNRYDDALLKLPEVVGHGVGYSETGSGVPVIKLFMRKASREARQAAPSQVEGIPVEIEETGEIRVVPNCVPRISQLE